MKSPPKNITFKFKQKLCISHYEINKIYRHSCTQGWIDSVHGCQREHACTMYVLAPLVIVNLVKINCIRKNKSVIDEVLNVTVQKLIIQCYNKMNYSMLYKN